MKDTRERGLPGPKNEIPRGLEWLLSKGLDLVRKPEAERDRLLKWIKRRVGDDEYEVTRTTRRGQIAFLNALGENDVHTVKLYRFDDGYVGTFFWLESRPGVYLLRYWKPEGFRSSRCSHFIVKVGNNLISDMDLKASAATVGRLKEAGKNVVEE